MSITQEQIAELAELNKRRTHGEWVYVPNFGIRALVGGNLEGNGPYPEQMYDVLLDDHGCSDDVPDGEFEANTELVPKVINALPDLLTEMERLRAVESKAKEATR